jgi:predicted nucleic acid-binding Zn ribbon protein
MPAYDYECLDCVKEFAVFLSIKDMEPIRRSSVLIAAAIMSKGR